MTLKSLEEFMDKQAEAGQWILISPHGKVYTGPEPLALAAKAAPNPYTFPNKPLIP
jgi:aromatic ring-opening dioxygenase LigB subunit